MAGVQYPYVKKTVVDDVDIVDDDDHNKQEDQLLALTNARGGTWADDLGRPTPDTNNPYPFGYNVSRGDYEFYNGSQWIQLEIVQEKGVAGGYAPLDGSALIPQAFLPQNPNPPIAHASQHEDGGSDEIDVTGLSGLLADGQNPLAHAASHEGGSDPISPSGIGADTPTQRDAAIATHAGVSSAHHTRPVDGELLPASHASSHESAGSDQINVNGLLGILANAQVPQVHKASHATGGTDAFLTTDTLEAQVKRIQDGVGQKWEIAALTSLQFLYADGSLVNPAIKTSAVPIYQGQVYAFGGATSPGISTSSGTYQTLRRIVVNTKFALPANVYALIEVQGGGTGDIALYDYLTGILYYQLLGVTATGSRNIYLIPIVNPFPPTQQTIVDVQLRATGAATTIYLDHLSFVP